MKARRVCTVLDLCDSAGTLASGTPQHYSEAGSIRSGEYCARKTIGSFTADFGFTPNVTTGRYFPQSDRQTIMEA